MVGIWSGDRAGIVQWARLLARPVATSIPRAPDFAQPSLQPWVRQSRAKAVASARWELLDDGVCLADPNRVTWRHHPLQHGQTHVPAGRGDETDFLTVAIDDRIP